jgi:hypothetical protein
MKRILFFLSIISIIFTLSQKSWAAPSPNHINLGVNIGFFYSSLSPHGEWIEVESGLRVWRPIHIESYWRPYLMGRWIWTDYGWYWMSSEPFGWITYHYGRWYNDDYYGWVWMPDDVWGPAWVEWRYDDDYIGWAPLPPYATFSISFGLRFTSEWTAPAHYWNFIRYHHFGHDFHYRDIASLEHTRRLIHTTRTGLRYDINNNNIINRGVDRSIIERRGNIRISKAEVRDMHDQSGERIIRSNNNRRIEQIEIYRPTRDEMQNGIERLEVRKSDRALSIDIKKIERPSIESHKTSEERTNREATKAEARQSERSIQHETRQQVPQREREVKREERPRESTPRVQERKSQQDRKEMRRELIQRYERKQSPAPRITREAQQKRIERPQRSHQAAQPSRSSREDKNSSRSGSRRRD